MRRIALAAAAGSVALALVALPLAPGAALAKSGGSNGAGHSGDKGGGKGHGKGGSGGPDTTTFVDSDGDSHGKGHSGHGKGHSKDAVSGVEVSEEGFHPNNHGALASMLGSLNAAHAIANGNTNDNLNSKVGQINLYMGLFEGLTESPDPVVDALALDAVAQALTDAWNKDSTITDNASVTAVVVGVNDLLGIDEESVTDSVTDREQAVANKISPPPDPTE